MIRAIERQTSFFRHHGFGPASLALTSGGVTDISTATNGAHSLSRSLTTPLGYPAAEGPAGIGNLGLQTGLDRNTGRRNPGTVLGTARNIAGWDPAPRTGASDEYPARRPCSWRRTPSGAGRNC